MLCYMIEFNQCLYRQGYQDVRMSNQAMFFINKAYMVFTSKAKLL